MAKTKKKTAPRKRFGIFKRLEALYARMQEGYDQTVGTLPFTCADCPQNCCVSYFQHHTYVEWAYMWQGIRALPEETRTLFLERAEDYARKAQGLIASGLRPRLMCPLNLDGRCGLYGHRLMICRLHGVANFLARPDGRVERFPGCFRFEGELEKAVAAGDKDTAHLLDRTPMYRELAAIEADFLGPRLRTLPKVDLTLAQMLVHGPPKVV